jgi:hypothetical protein
MSNGDLVFYVQFQVQPECVQELINPELPKFAKMPIADNL